MPNNQTNKKFYNGKKLLNMKDLNGERPEIFMVSSNRSAGKTTFFAKMLMDAYIGNGDKFCLVYRFKNELDGIHEKFFNDIKSLWYNAYDMESKPREKGNFVELLLDGESCGYAVALNGADNIRKCSHLLSDCSSMFFDEFQSESGHYCSKEIEKMMSLHTSLARGGGSQARYLPLYMCSNNVSILNPYYSQFGIAERLREDTKFLRGDGWVLEVNFNESASNAMQESGFMRAFKNTGYAQYAMMGHYLNDTSSFIERPSGMSRYMCTLKYEGKEYAVREFASQGLLYCDDKADASYPLKLTVTLEDHSPNYVMLNANQMLIGQMRWLFERGCFRFKNQKCKEVILNTLSYH